MIATVSGTIARIGPDFLVIDVGGVGLRISVPGPILENVGGIGRSMGLFTHLVVRETELSLYGFESEEDLNLFELLLGISGVGPKVSLSILSTLSPEVLKGAVIREETAVLQRVPGIGKKTAERIMFQLRDKMDLTAEAASAALLSDEDQDVIDFLTTLGFSIVEAQTAIQNIPPEIVGLESRVEFALRYLDQF
jgi:Holliday junction DNA helicase RuvA